MLETLSFPIDPSEGRLQEARDLLPAFSTPKVCTSYVTYHRTLMRITMIQETGNAERRLLFPSLQVLGIANWTVTQAVLSDTVNFLVELLYPTWAVRSSSSPLRMVRLVSATRSDECPLAIEHPDDPVEFKLEEVKWVVDLVVRERMKSVLEWP